jgi:hypothetical protein
VLPVTFGNNHNKTMNANQLETVANIAADDLKAMITESETEILEAIDACETEAKTQDKNAAFKIGFTITLAGKEQSNKLTYGVRRSLETAHEIEDAKQGKLPIAPDGEPTVEMRTGGKTTGPVPLSKFKAAVKVIKERAEAKE